MKEIKWKSGKAVTLYKFIAKRFLLITVLCVGLTSIIYYLYCTNIMVNDTKDSIKKVAVASQYIINGDVHEKLNDVNSKEYKDLCRILADFKKKSNVYDVYTMIKADDSHTKFVLASYDPESTFMKEYMFTDKMKAAYYNGDITVTDNAITDFEGTFYTAYAPLYNSNGKIVAIIGVDISAQAIIDMKHQILETIIFLFIITCLMAVFAGYHSTKPINRNMKTLNEFLLKVSEGDFSLTYDSLHTNIKEINDITDTINNMGKNLSLLIRIIAENSRKIDVKANEISTLVDKASLSSQIINSIVDEMVNTYENITTLTKQAIEKNKNELQSTANIKKSYTYFSNMLANLNEQISIIVDNFNKLKFINSNNGDKNEAKLTSKYMDNIENVLNEVSGIYKITLNILGELSPDNIHDGQLFEDKLSTYNDQILEKFNKINSANKYIAEGINDQSLALQGIIKEVDDLNEISKDLNTNLANISYHK